MKKKICIVLADYYPDISEMLAEGSFRELQAAEKRRFEEERSLEEADGIIQANRRKFEEGERRKEQENRRRFEEGERRLRDQVDP